MKPEPSETLRQLVPVFMELLTKWRERTAAGRGRMASAASLSRIFRKLHRRESGASGEYTNDPDEHDARGADADTGNQVTPLRIEFHDRSP